MHEHKKQLHERIMRRQSQLQAELEQVEKPNKTTLSQREVALADALALLQIHLATGWTSVGEVEASELSRWLDTTAYLIDETRDNQRADTIFDHLEAQWKLTLYGVPA